MSRSLVVRGFRLAHEQPRHPSGSRPGLDPNSRLDSPRENMSFAAPGSLITTPIPIRLHPVLIETASGLFCEAGGFHIDPWGTVDRAVVTHAHGDHARPGNGSYLCAEPCAPLLRRRFGPDATIDTLRYGESRRVGSIELSFHPAG